MWWGWVTRQENRVIMTYSNLWVLVITMSNLQNIPIPADHRQRRRAELRERLFRAALDLFARQGFAETTVEDITNAADVGKGTFFNYFPSKDHLLIAFSEMQLQKLQGLVAEAGHTAEPMPAFLR